MPTNRTYSIPMVVLALSAAATTAPASTAGSPGGQPGPVAGTATVRPAPVGHRQPRAADVPERKPVSAEDAEYERKERALRQRLQICRGC
jgi:hypothetical protein